MPKRANNPDQLGLLAFPEPTEPSTLSLAGESDSSTAQQQLDAQSGHPAQNVTVLRPRVDALASKPARFPQDESHFPSRKKKRKGLRGLDPQVLLKAETWCLNHKKYPFYKLVEELLRAFCACTMPDLPGVGDWAPGSDHDLNLNKEKEIDQYSDSSSSSSIVSGRPVAQTDPQDAESKRIEEIICFYEVTTGNRHRPEDVTALMSVFDLSDDTINTGILRSVVYCAERVGSFKYCLKAIRQISKSRIDSREEFWRMYETFFAKVKGGQLLLPRESTSFLEGKFGKAKDDAKS